MKFKIRCSAINQIMVGNIGLTATQEAKLQDMELREQGKHPKGFKLTANMVDEMADLRHKRDNPELPEGAKTYCKKWLKETLYKRREQVKSKYIEKGHATEEDGFTSMCVQLKLGYLQKNEDFKSNEFIMGTCDLDHPENDTVYDNKSSWSLDQFPMFDDKCPNQDYEAQIQGYMNLWGRKRGAVVYTLNDIPEPLLVGMMWQGMTDNEKQEIALPLIYTRKFWDAMKAKYFDRADDIDFIEIPEKDRVRPFYVDYDPSYIADVQERVKLCRKYIETLLK